MANEQDDSPLRPKKISLDQVEVIDQQGRVVKESDHSADARSPFSGQFKGTQFNGTPFGGMRVMKASPWMLLALPIVLPLLIFGVILLLFFALFFGKTVFKILKGPFPTKHSS
jgi:hypothetical protein